MLQLSWDLFIIVIIVAILAYSFIIGRENTLKVIISTYISVLTADAFGNLFHEYLVKSKPFFQFLKLFGVTSPDQALVLFKVILFIAVVVILTMKGNFEVKKEGSRGGIIGLITHVIFAFLSAGLVVSTLLTYVSGGSFVLGASNITSGALSTVYNSSRIVKLMLDNYNLWFSLPAVAFVLWSFFHKSDVT